MYQKFIKPNIHYLALAVFFVVAFIHAKSTGFNEGYAAATTERDQQQIAQYGDTLKTMERLVTDTNKASLLLGQTINDRILADNKTTQEIRRALSTTTHLRVDCKLPADIVRQLAAARDRANKAAASGIDSPMPTITRTD